MISRISAVSIWDLRYHSTRLADRLPGHLKRDIGGGAHGRFLDACSGILVEL
jgi:hypothetical protein